MTPLELKDARISLGFTQEKLAIELGVRRFTVFRWESGVHKVPRMLDLALKQLKREQRQLKVRLRRANRRRLIKSQIARGETGGQGIEFSSASVAPVVPQAKLS